ncbi:MAG: MBL fold metallo-hydrolase [Acidimicrobiales bacterium]
MAEPEAQPIALDELTLTVLVDNETDTLSSVDDGIPEIPEAATLASRLPLEKRGDHDCVTVFDHLCVACHGLSVLATGRRGDETHTVLFDVGPYPDVWLANAERQAVDLASIERLVLSHWHFDHSGGFPEVVRAISEARRVAGLAEPLVVDLHPDRPDQRGTRAPNGRFTMLPAEPTFHAIAAAGGQIETNAEAHCVANRFFLVSGEIPRVTDYEQGLIGHHSFQGDVAEPDPLILDERFLAAHVAGHGLSVLSACSHAGVVNACLAAIDAVPDAPIDIILGGYHLAGRGMEDRIEATVRDLAERISPQVVAPGHCTGWRAKVALAAEFAPGRYGPSVVGSRYVRSAES